MANRFDQTYLQQQKKQREQEKKQAQATSSDIRGKEKESEKKSPATSSKVAHIGQKVRGFFGGNFIRKIDFRKNLPYILMVFVMVIILIYTNLLTLSNQKKLEELDRERIKLNDKYIQIMDRREMLSVDENQRQALLQVYEDKGFVEDSSVVYEIRLHGKEARK